MFASSPPRRSVTLALVTLWVVFLCPSSLATTARMTSTPTRSRCTLLPTAKTARHSLTAVLAVFGLRGLQAPVLQVCRGLCRLVQKPSESAQFPSSHHRGARVLELFLCFLFKLFPRLWLAWLGQAQPWRLQGLGQLQRRCQCLCLCLCWR